MGSVRGFEAGEEEGEFCRCCCCGAAPARSRKCEAPRQSSVVRRAGRGMVSTRLENVEVRKWRLCSKYGQHDVHLRKPLNLRVGR